MPVYLPGSHVILEVCKFTCILIFYRECQSAVTSLRTRFVMSYEASDDGSDTETETVSEIGDGLLSVILSGSSCNLDDCANSVLTSNHELIIRTIDLPSVIHYLTKQGAISDEVNTRLSDESQPLVTRKEFFLTHIIKDKGIDRFNLLMGALKSCQHDPNQVALAEQLYTAMQGTFSSTETSREASPISVRDEWMSAYESATDEPTLANGQTDTPASSVTDVSNERTPLLPTTTTANHSPSVPHRKKKVRKTQYVTQISSTPRLPSD